MGQGDDTTKQSATRRTEVLYTHRARPEWGRAVIAWDRGEKQGFQFEDGKLRVLSKEYLHLVEMTEVAGDEEQEVLRSLRRKIGWSQPPQKTRAKKQVAVPVELQIELFASLYPKGFVGARWAREKRGIDTLRHLQRHRDGAVLEAQRLMSKGRLEALHGVGKHTAIIASIKEAGETTNLVAKAQLKALDDVSEEDAADLSERLIDLLHGDSAFGIRFERFVDALTRTTGKRPTWQLATFLLALVHPKEHLCVKPSSMKKQVACAGRLIDVPNVPDAPSYERLRLMVAAIHGQLQKAGYAPRDLLDAYDFIETTTTTKALRQMKAEQERDAA